MAQKLITDYQLRNNVSDDCNIVTDDGIQTYRITAAQIKAYILGAGNVLLSALALDIFSGLSAVSPAEDDYLTAIDTSDSGKTKKVLVSSLRAAPYRSVTATETVGANDEVLNLSGASFTITLPTAVGVAGKKYKFIHSGTAFTQVYTLATSSSQTIGGIASGSYALYTTGEVLEVQSDGANWLIVGRRTDYYLETTWADNWPNATTAVQITRRGNRVTVEGLTSVTGAGTTAIQFTVPTELTPKQTTRFTPASGQRIGDAELIDVSDSNVLGVMEWTGTNTFNIFVGNASGTYLGTSGPTATIPFTWANGDKMVWKAEYQVANWQP